jgi:hypothetical protein
MHPLGPPPSRLKVKARRSRKRNHSRPRRLRRRNSTRATEKSGGLRFLTSRQQFSAHHYPQSHVAVAGLAVVGERTDLIPPAPTQAISHQEHLLRPLPKSLTAAIVAIRVEELQKGRILLKKQHQRALRLLPLALLSNPRPHHRPARIVSPKRLQGPGRTKSDTRTRQRSLGTPTPRRFLARVLSTPDRNQSRRAGAKNLIVRVSRLTVMGIFAIA